MFIKWLVREVPEELKPVKGVSIGVMLGAFILLLILGILQLF